MAKKTTIPHTTEYDEMLEGLEETASQHVEQKKHERKLRADKARRDAELSKELSAVRDLYNNPLTHKTAKKGYWLAGKFYAEED